MWGLDSDMRDMRMQNRTAAGSALRRLVLAASACDDAACAASTAADEIAHLRANVAKAAAREEQRVRLTAQSSWNVGSAEDSSHAAGRAAHARADAALQANRQARLGIRRQSTREMDLLDASKKDKERRDDENDALRAEIASLQEEMNAKIEEASYLRQKLGHAESDRFAADESFERLRMQEGSCLNQAHAELEDERTYASAEAHAAAQAIASSREAAEVAKRVQIQNAALHSEIQAARAQAQAHSEAFEVEKRALVAEQELMAAALSKDSAQARVSGERVARHKGSLHRIVASLHTNQVAQLVCCAFAAWQHARKQSSEVASWATEAENLRSAAVAAVEEASADEAAAAQRALHAESQVLLSIHHQQQTSNVLASLMAHNTENMCRFSLRAWRAATDASLVQVQQESHVQGIYLEAQSARSAEADVADLQAKLVTLKENCGHQEQQLEHTMASRVQQTLRMEEQASKELLSSHSALKISESKARLLAEELSEARAAAAAALDKSEVDRTAILNLQESYDTLSNEAMAALHSAGHSALQMRRGEAAQRLVASFLASHSENALWEAFCAWRQMMLVEEKEREGSDKASMELQQLRHDLESALLLAKTSQEKADASTSELADAKGIALAHKEATNEVTRLQKELDAALQLADSHKERAEAYTLKLADAEESAGVKSEEREKAAELQQKLEDALRLAKLSQEEANSSANELAHTKNQVCAHEESAKEAAGLRQELEKALQLVKQSQEKCEAHTLELADATEAARGFTVLQEELGSALHLSKVSQDKAEECSRELACAKAARHMLATALAANLEQVVLSAFLAWRAATSKSEADHAGLSSAITQSRSRELKLEAENETMFNEATMAKAASSIMAHREQAARFVLCSVLSRHLEHLVFMAFNSWVSARLNIDAPHPGDTQKSTEKTFTEGEAGANGSITSTCSASGGENDVLRDATVALVLHRESVARSALSSHMARHLEYVVRTALMLWHDALTERDVRFARRHFTAWKEFLHVRRHIFVAMRFRAWRDIIHTKKSYLKSRSFTTWRMMRHRPTDATCHVKKLNAEMTSQQEEITKLKNKLAEVTGSSEAGGHELALQLLVSQRREAASTSLVASLLAAATHAFVYGAFVSWKASVNCDQADLERVSRERDQARDEAARALDSLKKSEEQAMVQNIVKSTEHEQGTCAAALAAHREATARNMIAGMLAANLEMLIRGTFCLWCEFTIKSQASVQTPVKEEMATEFVEHSSATASPKADLQMAVGPHVNSTEAVTLTDADPVPQHAPSPEHVAAPAESGTPRHVLTAKSSARTSRSASVDWGAYEQDYDSEPEL